MRIKLLHLNTISPARIGRIHKDVYFDIVWILDAPIQSDPPKDKSKKEREDFLQGLYKKWREKRER